ncbi:MAG: hypothetical protein JKY11_04350 [Alphaproteobacteria bacterium]|nr:hypothetical protein [Alphaproteobacteria bacterium]
MAYRYSKKQVRRKDAILGGIMLLTLLVIIVTMFFMSLMGTSSASNITSGLFDVCYSKDNHQICL